MRPGTYHDDALPRPTDEGLFGTIYCTRCDFFGLGYNHPEWCRWAWLAEVGRRQHHLDVVELGDRVSDALRSRRGLTWERASCSNGSTSSSV